MGTTDDRREVIESSRREETIQPQQNERREGAVRVNQRSTVRKEGGGVKITIHLID